MFAALTSLYTSITQERIPPSSWDPSSPLPAGSFKQVKELTARITERSSLVVVAEGAWGHGTLQFEVAGGGGGAGGGAGGAGGLPSYDDAVQQLTAGPHRTARQEKREGGQLGEGEAEMRVRVEARWNDEVLWEESSVELKKSGDGEEWRLSVKTPSMSPSRLASQLSFHITLTFPSSLSSLHSLQTSASQWRHLGAPSLSSLHFAQLSLATANAALSFDHLSAGRTSLKTANAPVEGRYALQSLDLQAENAKISGSYLVATVATVRTSNRPVEGAFEAEELEVKTSNGKIGGRFEGRRRLKLETVNRGIEGVYRVGGEVWFKTCNGGIEGDVEVLSSAEARKEGTPPLLAEDVKKSEGGEVGPRITGEAKTANGPIDLRFGKAPSGTEIQFEAKSPNGRVRVAVAGPFDGTFHASTSNASANITAPSSHTISYDQESKNKVTGRVSSGGEEGEGSKGSLKVESSNREAVIEVV